MSMRLIIPRILVVRHYSLYDESMAISRNDLIEHLTEVLLVDHGFDDDEDARNDVEWDPDDPDSQYSIIRDDVEVVVTVLEEIGLISFK